MTKLALLIVGVALVVAGVALWSIPAAVVTAGVLALGGAALADLAERDPVSGEQHAS